MYILCQLIFSSKKFLDRLRFSALMMRKRRNSEGGRLGGGGPALSTRDSQFFALWSSVRARLGSLRVLFRELQPLRVPGACVFSCLSETQRANKSRAEERCLSLAAHWVLPMAKCYGKWWISAAQSLSGVSGVSQGKLFVCLRASHQSDAPRASHSIFSPNTEVLFRPSVCRFIFLPIVGYSF
jgi:hypothetical protein